MVPGFFRSGYGLLGICPVFVEFIWHVAATGMLAIGRILTVFVDGSNVAKLSSDSAVVLSTE